jgi:predicted nucleotide-binding protein
MFSLLRVDVDDGPDSLAKINQRLLARLSKHLEVSKARVYQLIDAEHQHTMLPKGLAALSLAAKVGISPGRYATADELRELRSVAQSVAGQAITAQPIAPAAQKAKKPKKPQSDRRAKQSRAWVVHGRDLKARDALVAILESLGVKVLDFKSALMRTRQGSPYVGTVLSTAFTVADIVVVLLTPDDDAKLRKTFYKKNEPTYEKTLMGQPRPNVLFEAGQAFGIHRDRTILVQVGRMKPQPTDVLGRHICMLSNDPDSRDDLVKRLRGVGAAVDTNDLKYLKNFPVLDW